MQRYERSSSVCRTDGYGCAQLQVSVRFSVGYLRQSIEWSMNVSSPVSSPVTSVKKSSLSQTFQLRITLRYVNFRRIWTIQSRLLGVGCGWGRKNTLRANQRLLGHLYSPLIRRWPHPRGAVCGRSSGATGRPARPDRGAQSARNRPRVGELITHPQSVPGKIRRAARFHPAMSVPRLRRFRIVG